MNRVTDSISAIELRCDSPFQLAVALDDGRVVILNPCQSVRFDEVVQIVGVMPMAG